MSRYAEALCQRVHGYANGSAELRQLRERLRHGTELHGRKLSVSAGAHALRRRVRGPHLGRRALRELHQCVHERLRLLGQQLLSELRSGAYPLQRQLRQPNE
jgi:hypothetical protein